MRIMVVGAGAAGCVIANRLSARPDLDVTLVEAGPEADGSGGRELGDGDLRHDWGHSAAVTSGRRIPYAQGRVLGGGTAVNSAVATRGRPRDFEAWSELAGPSWTFAQVLDTYVEMETDHDFSDSYHGRSGPVPIRRTPTDRMIEPQRRFLEGAVEAGHPFAPDLNAPASTGAGPWPRNTDPHGSRVSTASLYLDPARGRSNLRVITDAETTRLELDARARVSGVQLLGPTGTLETVACDLVVLAAGAIATPVLLLRSGIGRHGTVARSEGPLVELPAIGDGLEDHALVGIAAVPRPGVLDGMAERRIEVGVRYTSGPSSPTDDMAMLLTLPIDVSGQPLAEVAGADRIMRLGVGLMTPDSRGKVRLDTARRADISLDLLAADTDRRRLADGLRHAYELLTSPAMSPSVERVVGVDDRLLDDDEALDTYIAENVMSFRHPSSTVHMGTDPASSPTAPDGCLRNVSNLVVADASLLPRTVSAPINLTVIMVAERIAGALLARL